MVVAVKRGVGGGCLRGELCFHAKILGSAPSLGLILPLRLIYLQSSGLKCLEQTLIPSNIEKSLPTSLLMAWAHCFLVLGLSGKQKKDIFSPRIFVSLILLCTQLNATMCWHLSANLRVENILVGQSCPLQRLREPFTQLCF